MAPPPGTRGAAGLSAGDLLAARYRLVAPCPAPTPGASPRLWLAHDEVLAGVQAARRTLAHVLAPLVEDRVLSTDIEAVAALVDDGSLQRAVEQAVGPLEPA